MTLLCFSSEDPKTDLSTEPCLKILLDIVEPDSHSYFFFFKLNKLMDIHAHFLVKLLRRNIDQSFWGSRDPAEPARSLSPLSLVLTSLSSGQLAHIPPAQARQGKVLRMCLRLSGLRYHLELSLDGVCQKLSCYVGVLKAFLPSCSELYQKLI